MASKKILKNKKYLQFTYPQRNSNYPNKLGSYLTKKFFGPNNLGLEVLDIGCGDGEFLNVFSKLGFEPIGVDVSPVDSDHEIYKVDLEEQQLPLKDNSINFVFSKSVIEHIDHTHVTPFTRHSLEETLKMSGFEDVEVTYFYQLPFVWKNPILKLIPKLVSILPIPFRPFRKSFLPNSLNKFVRFSNEVMLLAYARKEND
mgnify:CR=1 FL=1